GDHGVECLAQRDPGLEHHGERAGEPVEDGGQHDRSEDRGSERGAVLEVAAALRPHPEENPSAYNQNGAADDRNEPAGAVDYADQDPGGQGQLNLELREDPGKGRQSEEVQDQTRPGV